MNNYAWIITRDFLYEEGPSIYMKSNVGTHGPRNTRVDYPSATPGAMSKDDVMFRLYDDDDRLYYEGIFRGNWKSEDGFGPLDDFGEPDSGCTRIDYFDPETESWETL